MNFEIKLIDGSSYITFLSKEDIQKDQSAIETFLVFIVELMAFIF